MSKHVRSHTTPKLKSQILRKNLRKRKKNAKKAELAWQLANSRAIERNALKAQRHAAHMEACAKKKTIKEALRPKSLLERCMETHRLGNKIILSELDNAIQ